MPLLHLFILALIQGITEFLPISSSGHLILAHAAMDGQTYTQENLLLDIGVHVGTLLAVLLYYRQDVLKMFAGLKDLVSGQRDSENARLDLYMILGSVPVIIAGLILYKLDPSWLRSVEVVAWTTLIFGFLLWVVDIKAPAARDMKEMTWKDALFIGLAQIIALIPGTSRSGITMTAGRWRGFTRTESAHFSLLLSMVAISGAGFLASLSLLESGDLLLTYDVLIAAGLAFIAAWVAITVMMAWLKRATFTPFAIYRIILGLILLGITYEWITF